ncbi:ABC transporter ATP-binding protein [Halosolutus halophilus]|uniref:ABC transporter ATP-binding protein n=1 Tax=Halosolutus halophilus TaxID=1552990 RepID=UPI002235180A|nr:ABC transporter ATP-binding protein [Halosolutus halophilus]
MTAPLLSVSNLRTYFRTDRETVRAVDGVDFDVHRGETVALVGESGSGKTVACESITGLLEPSAELVGGEVEFDGIDLTGLSSGERRSVRGNRIGHVFQNPQRSLSPVYTIGEQLVEAMTIHDVAAGQAARDRAIELLDRVGIPRPAARIDDYPHQFSGGMRQRVAIAIALAADPELLVADEPTTALDVTVQAQLLELLGDLQRTLDLAVILVTHDFRVVAELADRVVVMYDGAVMERGDVADVFDEPAHPYTRALLAREPGFPESGPTADRPADEIGGEPDGDDGGSADGCRFSRECPHAIAECRRGVHPPLFSTPTGQSASCIYYDEASDSDLVRARARVTTEVADDE